VTTAIVAGCIANRHLYGGGAWVRRSWAEGLRRLGFDVFYLEHILPEKCVDTAGNQASFESCVNREYFDLVMSEFGLTGSCALAYGDGEDSHGAPYNEVLERADDAALLVNISGNLQLDEVKRRIRRKVYIDVDPGWTQVAASTGDLGPRLAGHDLYFTIGENVGKPFCPIEMGDVPWGTVRQPVVLDDWPASASMNPTKLTTIATLKGPGPFPRAKINGRMYGLKGDELSTVIDVPSHAPQTFEIAVRRTVHWDDQVAPLLDHGWHVVDASTVSHLPSTFRTYVDQSGGEFSTARGVYVHTLSGWFSDRTIRYLAMGRPALVQDTGFSRNIPTGEGLVAFGTREEAIAGAERIAASYEAHSKAARAIAEEYFDSDTVLGRFAEQIDVSP
jgi:hypothetical protein